VKEALFSILSSRIDFDGIRVLDICAGTGSLGIEALSRGAGFCCFVESDKSVKTILSKNLTVTGFLGCSELVSMDALHALPVVARSGQCYNLAFFDPPYASGLYAQVLEVIASSGLLLPGAIVVAECSTRMQLPESYGRLKRFDRRVYGETALELYISEE
jgi:16S rRNA (guanine(966)-N(2))-methyltransferase RsmD